MYVLVPSWSKKCGSRGKERNALDLTSYALGPELRASASFTEPADFTEEGERHRNPEDEPLQWSPGNPGEGQRCSGRTQLQKEGLSAPYTPTPPLSNTSGKIQEA